MVIDDEVFQQTLDILRIKCRNNSVRIAYINKYNPDIKLDNMEGYQQGLEIGYAILNCLYYNKVPFSFQERNITLNEMEQYRETIIRSFGIDVES